MMKIFLILISLLTIINNSFARPISYSGVTTIMQNNGAVKNSVHLHYSPNYKYSIGYKGEYFIEDKISLNSLQLNNLLKRWNFPGAQSNIYLKSNIGDAKKSEQNELYGSIGIAGDFETRKYFISYENKYYKSDNIIDQFEQNARIGIAPYIANYGNLHSWLMLQFTHIPEFEGDEIIVTPLVRLFKASYLTEFGFSSNKKFLFNFIIRF